jgi:hypothetical protein
MRKFFARVAHLLREIAVFLVPILTAIKLIVEIAKKVANCNACELSFQVSGSRQVHLCT